MLKNKKSFDINTDFIVRLVFVAAVILLIVMPAGSKLYAKIFSQMYDKSFESFVNEINKPDFGKEDFQLRLKAKSAIVGFSKNTERFECINCYGAFDDKPTIIFEKPKREECLAGACVCLCSEGLGLEKSEDMPTGTIHCSEMTCIKVEQRDIIDKVIIRTNDASIFGVDVPGGATEYWKNGFLYVNDMDGINGIKSHNEEINYFKVEKRQNIVGVCNQDIFNLNKKLGFNTCVITKFDEAKKLENTNAEEAIQKYKEFVQKYQKGQEAEEALFKIGKLSFEIKNYRESADTLNKFIIAFPTSSYRSEAEELLNKLKNDYKTIPSTAS